LFVKIKYKKIKQFKNITILESEVYYGKNYELYREYSDSSIDLKSRYLTIILKFY